MAHKSRVLEIGCAYGFLLSKLEETYDTVGVDISKWALRNAKRYLCQSEIIRGDANGFLMFKDSTFDCVVVIDVLEHLADFKNYINDFHRILRRNGFLIFRTPNLSSIMARIKGKKWHFYTPDHISMMTSSEWVRLLDRHGFRVLDVYGSGFWDILRPFRDIFVSFYLVGFHFPSEFSDNIIGIAQKSLARTTCKINTHYVQHEG